MAYNEDMHITAGRLRSIGVTNVPDGVHDDDYTAKESCVIETVETPLIPYGIDVLPRAITTIIDVDLIEWTRD